MAGDDQHKREKGRKGVACSSQLVRALRLAAAGAAQLPMSERVRWCTIYSGERTTTMGGGGGGSGYTGDVAFWHDTGCQINMSLRNGNSFSIEAIPWRILLHRTKTMQRMLLFSQTKMQDIKSGEDENKGNSSCGIIWAAKWENKNQDKGHSPQKSLHLPWLLPTPLTFLLLRDVSRSSVLSGLHRRNPPPGGKIRACNAQFALHPDRSCYSFEQPERTTSIERRINQPTWLQNAIGLTEEIMTWQLPNHLWRIPVPGEQRDSSIYFLNRACIAICRLKSPKTPSPRPARLLFVCLFKLILLPLFTYNGWR